MFNPENFITLFNALLPFTLKMNKHFALANRVMLRLREYLRSGLTDDVIQELFKDLTTLWEDPNNQMNISREAMLNVFKMLQDVKIDTIEKTELKNLLLKLENNEDETKRLINSSSPNIKSYITNKLDHITDSAEEKEYLTSLKAIATLLDRIQLLPNSFFGRNKDFLLTTFNSLLVKLKNFVEYFSRNGDIDNARFACDCITQKIQLLVSHEASFMKIINLYLNPCVKSIIEMSILKTKELIKNGEIAKAQPYIQTAFTYLETYFQENTIFCDADLTDMRSVLTSSLIEAQKRMEFIHQNNLVAPTSLSSTAPLFTNQPAPSVQAEPEKLEATSTTVTNHSPS